MSKYVGTMFKYFVELCTIRGIRYMMFRTESTNVTMYIFDLSSKKYEITSDAVILSDVWQCTFLPNGYLDTVISTYKIHMSDDSQLNFLDQAIYLYDEIVSKSNLLTVDNDYSYIYIPHKSDFVITEWKDLEEPLNYFQPCYYLFDGVDIRFNKVKTSLLLFYLLIGRYGCGMIFENLEDYLKWSFPIQKYISEKSINNIPIILWKDELGFLIYE